MYTSYYRQDTRIPAPLTWDPAALSGYSRRHGAKKAVRSFPRTAVFQSFEIYILQPVAGSASPLTATF